MRDTTLATTVFQGQKFLVLSMFLLLDGFALGGCAVLLMIRNLLLEKCCSAEPVWAIYNLLDYLVPYYLAFGSALLILIVATVFVWLTIKHFSIGWMKGT